MARTPKPVRFRQMLRAICVGFGAGLVGSAAKLLGEAIYPPRTRGQKAPPAVLAEKLVGHSLSSRDQMIASQAFHWLMGTGLGGIYAGVSEMWPAATSGFGVAFGTVLCLATHESTLPLLGLAEEPREQSVREHASEFLTHAMYGIAVEGVRRYLLSSQSENERGEFLGDV